MRSAIRCSTWFCLSLMLWTAAAEPVHSHPNQLQSATCSMCILAHSASPVRVSHAVPVLSAIGVLQEEEVVAEVWVTGFELVIRGPPAA
jgi:hypothetical protein